MFLDADVRLGPDALDHLVVEHSAEPDALLSVQPFHVTKRHYEQLSAVANVVTMMAARWSRRAAFGPCLVTTPSALRAAGGFGAVRGEIVEDIALAARYKPVRLRLGGDVVSFRMYEEGLAQLVQGWVKNLALGARRVAAVPSLAAGLWVTGALAATTSWWYLAYAAQIALTLRRLGRFRMGLSRVLRTSLCLRGAVCRVAGWAPLRVMARSAVLIAVLYAAWWAVVHTSTGYFVHRLPTTRLRREGTFSWEQRVYERLRVKKWKDKLPEAGAFSPGGISKRHVGRSTLARFVVETRRAELGHWLAMLGGPVAGRPSGGGVGFGRLQRDDNAIAPAGHLTFVQATIGQGHASPARTPCERAPNRQTAGHGATGHRREEEVAHDPSPH